MRRRGRCGDQCRPPPRRGLFGFTGTHAYFPFPLRPRPPAAALPDTLSRILDSKFPSRSARQANNDFVLTLSASEARGPAARLFLSTAARSLLDGLRGAPLAPPFARPRVAPGQARDAVEKGVRAERAADRLGGAQGGDFCGIGLLGDEIGEAPAAALDERRDLDQPVVA